MFLAATITSLATVTLQNSFNSHFNQREPISIKIKTLKMIFITLLINFLLFSNIRADDTELRCEQLTVDNFDKAINSKDYAFIL